MIFGNQCTIINPISCFGVGLHSGENINLTMRPAEIDTGITFRIIDKEGKLLGEIPALYNLVSDTRLNTTISSSDDKLKLSTIEHLMAALWGCGIDNLIIEIDGNEVPIMDGSSSHFKFMIDCAGVKKQPKGRKIIEILKPVEAHINDAYAHISPSDDFAVSMEIDFASRAISKQKYCFNITNSCFNLDLSRARTFGFLDEVEKLQKAGLGRGGSLDNAVIIDNDKIMNQDGLRFNDEFVRHKVLDSIGDLYLAGAYIKGHFNGYKSGHTLNNTLLRKVFADESAYRVIQLPSEDIPQVKIAAA